MKGIVFFSDYDLDFNYYDPDFLFFMLFDTVFNDLL